MKLKRNDLVVVISGVHKGSSGRVLRILKDSGRVLVQGVNLRYKPIRRSQKHPQGGRVQVEMPLHMSNIQLVDPKEVHPESKKPMPTRIGYRMEGGRKVRFAKRSGDAV